MQHGQERGKRWEGVLEQVLSAVTTVEAAVERLYEALDLLPEWPAEVGDVLLASHLGGIWTGVGSVAAENLNPYALPPREAIAFFGRKKVVDAEEYAQDADLYKSRFFTLGRVADRYVADHVHARLLEALKEGTSLPAFMDDVGEHLKRLGVVSPGDYYWELVFRNNIQSAYNAGRWRQQRRVRGTRPYLRYVAIMDSRTRPVHRAFNGVILPLDHPFWASHYPPNGHKCRCRVRSVSAKELREEGLEPTADNAIPELWPDAGFKGNPGARMESELLVYKLARQVKSKLGRLKPGAALARSQRAVRLEELDGALGLTKEQQAELLTSVNRIRTGVDLKVPAAGEVWVEWSGWAQDQEQLHLLLVRLLQDPDYSALALRVEMLAMPVLQGNMSDVVSEPQVVTERLGVHHVGKGMQVRIRLGAHRETAEALLDFFQAFRQSHGYVLPGLSGGMMDLVVRGAQLENGLVPVYRNVKQVGGVTVEGWSRDALEGWESEACQMNEGLAGLL